MEFIRISEMLEVMDLKGEDGLPIPFKIRFITGNVAEQTGGKRITYEAAVLVGGVISKSEKRNPSNHKNYTRNLRAVNNNEVRKFHPLLVEMFNDLKVVA